MLASVSPSPPVARAAAGSGPALVLGCGACVGMAWTIGALAVVRDELGWEPHAAPVIQGTSAGGELALILGSGRSIGGILDAALGAPGADPLLAAHLSSPPGRPPLPAPRPTAPGLMRRARRTGGQTLTGLAGLVPRGRGDLGFLRDLADALAPDGRLAHPDVRMVAVDTDSGERVAFGAPGAPPAALRDAVAATWAVPGLFAPVEIGGRMYFDGGAASPSSVDLLLNQGVSDVVLLTPMTTRTPVRRRGAGRAEQRLRAAMTAITQREVRALRQAGIGVTWLEPGQRDLDAMGPNLMDGRRRLTALEMALRTTRETLRSTGTIGAAR